MIICFTLVELTVKIQIVAGIIKKINESRESTIAFNETKNRWTTFYSFQPDYMVMNNVGIVSFKKGQLYLHEKNVLFNNFYNEQFSSEIHFVSNTAPNEVKTYLALSEKSQSIWEVYEILTPHNQLSELQEQDFESIEHGFYAAILRDANTKNVAFPLIEGQILKDRTCLFKLKNKSTESTKLFEVNVRHALSARINS